MPYNATIADATAMAPQLGTLSATTTPTSTQATDIWDRAFFRIQAQLLHNGVGVLFDGGSVAEGWILRLETLLTSGELLLAKGSVGVGAESTAPKLISMAEAMLEEIQFVRQVLIDNGGSEDPGSADSRMSSHWLRAKDPEWDSTPGGPDVPYADTPVFPDGSDL